MKIESKHLNAANLLITSRFDDTTLEDIANGVGVSRRTLMRWRANKDFQSVYDGLLSEFLRNISSKPMAQRADRISELWRLYCGLPDQTEHTTRSEDNKGTKLSLRIEHNQLKKAKILGQIGAEAEAGRIDEIVDEVDDLRQLLDGLQGDPASEAS
jgi:AcrR family transcriptional regulator